jgi:hypothetical protein
MLRDYAVEVNHEHELQLAYDSNHSIRKTIKVIFTDPDCDGILTRPLLPALSRSQRKTKNLSTEITLSAVLSEHFGDLRKS